MSKTNETLMEEIKKETKKDRRPVTFYMSESLLETFKKYCGEIPQSRVLEKLVKRFIEGAA